ncbi:hypothetical protein [Glycocaulis sp.]|uniref:hypothetical protein n=1 Tax=Glycocaulis sp. TaxID=1969725 RepID=UPI003F6FCE2C
MSGIRGSVWAAAGLTALAAGACVSAAVEDDTQMTAVRAPLEECSAVTRSNAPIGFYGMDRRYSPSETMSSVAVVAGASFPFRIGEYYGPSGVRPVPGQCIEWQIEPPGHASLSEEGERLTIADDLPVGSVVELRAVIAQEGEPTRTGALRISIVDEASRQLIGTWSFEDVRGCSRMSIDPPREVRFDAENFARVAWTVFERYWDYWGHYTWDPETGAFGLEPTGGNRLPPDVSATGRLVVEEERQLAISGLHFGTREPDRQTALVSAADAGCTLVFRRQM